MEVGRVTRLSTSRRSEANSVSPTFDRAKLADSGEKTCHGHLNHHEQPQQQQQKNRTTNKMMSNKVQVVYYLTRNGQLEHPHFMEVSHLATQPLRLKDVIDRLTVLRGKAMPHQYSWSCKRSYKNGYVWNDLTENDAIYACEGSEYVLKGSEIIHDPDFSAEVSRSEELQVKRRQQRKGSRMNTDGSVTNKSRGTHNPGLNNHRQVKTTKHNGKQTQDAKNYATHDDEEDDDDDEEKGSCNSSSNAPYASTQMDQEESFSMPSTSSTNSDKQPPPPPPPPPPPAETPVAVAAESKRYEKEASRVVQEDGDTTISTSLSRNSTTLLHLIACGGGGMVGPKNTAKAKANNNNNGSESNRSLNFSMKNSFMPCLKQQLSSRGVSTSVNINPLCVKEQKHHDDDDEGKNVDDDQVVKKKNEDEDEDMMMVRYMSENPRFGNVQSEEKEYFSGTIVEATSSNHHHTYSSVSTFTHPPVLTKSSSYNENNSSTKAGSQAEAVGPRVRVEDEEDDQKVKGIIKLCIPRKKSISSTTSIKHTC